MKRHPVPKGHAPSAAAPPKGHVPTPIGRVPVPPKGHVPAILVFCPGHIGDSLLTGPAIALLKNIYPKGAIDIVTYSRTPFAIYRSNPNIRKIFLYKDVYRLLFKKGKYDIAVLLSNSILNALLSIALRIPVRVGTNEELVGWLLTAHVPYLATLKMHMTDKYIRIAGLLKSLPFTPRLEMYPSKKDENAVRSILKRLKILPRKGKIAVLNTRTTRKSKKWPDRYFSEVARSLIKKKYKVLFTGGPDDRDSIGKSFSGIIDGSRAINLSGRLNLLQLYVLFRNYCDILVTCDSGPMHIASAAGARVYALFGSTRPEICGPYNRNKKIFRSRHRCPAFKRALCVSRDICLEGRACLEKIKPSTVIKGIR